MALALALRAGAQAPAWTHDFVPAGVSGAADVVVSSVGGSPQLYATGTFKMAGSTEAACVARWNGQGWSALGAGLEQVPEYPAGPWAKAHPIVIDDWNGVPRLFAHGTFNRSGTTTLDGLAMWDGASWSAIPRPAAYTLLVTATPPFAGQGSRLFASTFTALQAWDGSTWSALAQSDGWIRQAVYGDLGQGPSLYVEGWFTQIGGIAAPGLVRFDGASFWPVPAPPLQTILDLAIWDDGSGPALYAAGQVDSTQLLHKLSGGTWQPVAGPFVDAGNPWAVIHDLAVVDMGAGPQLGIAGMFTSVAGTAAVGIALWDGSQITAVGQGAESARKLTSADLGQGPRLFVGYQGPAGPRMHGAGVAQWDGSRWTPLSRGNGAYATGLCVRRGDRGDELVVGSNWMLGQIGVRGYGLWDGAQWSADPAARLMDPTAQLPGHHMFDLVVDFDDGGGTRLWLASTSGLGEVFRTDGATWETLPRPFLPWIPVTDLVVHDDGGGAALYASARDDQPLQTGIARWTGNQWAELPLSSPAISRIEALRSHDDGSGQALYVAGAFWGGLRRWRAGAWELFPPQHAVFGRVNAFETFDDGSGSALYVAGRIDAIGSVQVKNAARWDGTAWSPVGDPATSPLGEVSALTVHDDGTGPALYAGLDWGHTGCVVWKWTGSAWTPIGCGFDLGVTDMASVRDGAGGRSSLYVCGQFREVEGRPSMSLARYGLPREAGRPLCNGDGIDPSGVAPCPCVNVGAPGHGCGHSQAERGAILSATGSLSPDTITLRARGLPGASVALLAASLTPSARAPFGDGVSCLAGSVLRLGTSAAQDGVVWFPVLGSPGLAAASGTPPGSGIVAHYQVRFRDATSYCTPAAFNLTNAWSVTW